MHVCDEGEEERARGRARLRSCDQRGGDAATPLPERRLAPAVARERESAASGHCKNQRQRSTEIYDTDAGSDLHPPGRPVKTRPDRDTRYKHADSQSAMSTSAGRPRPFLNGVFRTACNYCVSSKRGCSGGQPCEQCEKRGKACVYAKRRMSGPRGRSGGGGRSTKVRNRVKARRESRAAAAAAAVAEASAARAGAGSAAPVSGASDGGAGDGDVAGEVRPSACRGKQLMLRQRAPLEIPRLGGESKGDDSAPGRCNGTPTTAVSEMMWGQRNLAQLQQQQQQQRGALKPYSRRLPGETWVQPPPLTIPPPLLTSPMPSRTVATTRAAALEASSSTLPPPAWSPKTAIAREPQTPRPPTSTFILSPASLSAQENTKGPEGVIFGNDGCLEGQASFHSSTGFSRTSSQASATGSKRARFSPASHVQPLSRAAPASLMSSLRSPLLDGSDAGEGGGCGSIGDTPRGVIRQPGFTLLNKMISSSSGSSSSSSFSSSSDLPYTGWNLLEPESSPSREDNRNHREATMTTAAVHQRGVGVTGRSSSPPGFSPSPELQQEQQQQQQQLQEQQQQQHDHQQFVSKEELSLRYLLMADADDPAIDELGESVKHNRSRSSPNDAGMSQGGRRQTVTASATATATVTSTAAGVTPMGTTVQLEHNSSNKSSNSNGCRRTSTFRSSSARSLALVCALPDVRARTVSAERSATDGGGDNYYPSPTAAATIVNGVFDNTVGHGGGCGGGGGRGVGGSGSGLPRGDGQRQTSPKPFPFPLHRRASDIATIMMTGALPPPWGSASSLSTATECSSEQQQQQQQSVLPQIVFLGRPNVCGDDRTIASHLDCAALANMRTPLTREASLIRAVGADTDTTTLGGGHKAIDGSGITGTGTHMYAGTRTLDLNDNSHCTDATAGIGMLLRTPRFRESSFLQQQTFGGAVAADAMWFPEHGDVDGGGEEAAEGLVTNNGELCGVDNGGDVLGGGGGGGGGCAESTCGEFILPVWLK
ncbi:unnamed protein product [Pylaiella littoralis]